MPQETITLSTNEVGFSKSGISLIVYSIGTEPLRLTLWKINNFFYTNETKGYEIVVSNTKIEIEDIDTISNTVKFRINPLSHEWFYPNGIDFDLDENQYKTVNSDIRIEFSDELPTTPAKAKLFFNKGQDKGQIYPTDKDEYTVLLGSEIQYNNYRIVVTDIKYNPSKMSLRIFYLSNIFKNGSLIDIG